MMPPTVMCTVEGVNTKALLDYVEEHPDEMRPMSATIETKPGYDAAYFKADPNYIFVGMTQLWAKLKEQGICPVERGNIILINGLHEGQMYVNTTRLLNIDGTNVYDLTRGETEGHLQLRGLIETFRRFVPGFENCYISSIAPTIGIRETRRFKGLSTVTLEEALDGSIPRIASASRAIPSISTIITPAEPSSRSSRRPLACPTDALSAQSFPI